MRIRYVTPLLLLALLLPASASAQSGIPDLNSSWCEAQPGRFVIVPSGAGPSLIDQGTEVHVWIRDMYDNPVANYPREDIWMWNVDGDISLCQSGMIADADTDPQGHTSFTGIVYGGGWTHHMTVYAAGNPIAQTPEGSDYLLDLRVNSPDINADRAVNIQDLALFAGDITGYVFRSDFNHDDALDLSDIALFSGWLGADCP